MNNFKNLSKKEKAAYIGILLIYPLLLLFGQLGKTFRFFAMRRRQITASILSLAIMFTTIPFASLTAFAEGAVKYGDVNNSGDIDENDVTDLKKYLAEHNISIHEKNSDVNVDGAIDLRDLLLLEQFIAGLPVLLGEVVTVTFYTDGSSVAPIKLCKGATFASVVDETPTSEKDGYIFSGWKVNSATGDPFYAEDEVVADIDVYAAFEKIASKASLSLTSFSLEDQATSLSFGLVSEKAITEEEVKNLITLVAIDGSDPVGLNVQKTSEKEFTVKAAEGFTEGASYKLTLGDGLSFRDKEKTIHTANFTIKKEEVDNLSFNDSVIYIKDTDSMDYVLDGKSESVPVLETSMLSNNNDNAAVTGYFNYSDAVLTVGNMLCIYESIHPVDRDYTKNDYSDDAMSFVEVTAVSGTKISFKSINEADAEKVVFIPDTIPFSVDSLPTENGGTVNLSTYDSTAWLFMECTGVPNADTGDFIVFYNGTFSELDDSDEVYFGKITAVNGDVLTYIKTTTEEIKKSQDMFIENPVSGDKLLEGIDKELIEEQVESQAYNSGFAYEAANYLASVAQQTDGFTSLKPEEFTATIDGKKYLSAKQLQNIGGSWELKDGVTITATLGKSNKYFSDGLSLALRIDAEFSVDVGEDGEMKIDLSATFVEEISVDVQINANAKVEWILIVPKFKSLRFGAAVDVKNYSAISLDVKIYTVQKEDESFWEKLKGYNKAFGELLDQAEALKNKIDEAKETADTIKGYKEDLEKLWGTITKTSGDGLTQDSYEDLIGTLGELNVTQQMTELLHLTTNEEMDAGVQNLMERYSEMLETESDWVTLLDKEIFETEVHPSIFAICFGINFVIKANVNIALGANLEYVVGKRYSFWIDIVEKTSGSDTMDLLDERFAFQFYVMGAMGLKMGVKAAVKVGIISTKIGSIGVSAEFGPYIKLWGYFIYEYSKMRPAGTNAWNYDERMMGALYLEFGLYLEVAFEAQILDGLLSYNPTLCDLEFPLLTAGNRKNYYDFGYEIDGDESVLVTDADANSNNGISMVLPENYREMKYIDLVSGDLEQEVIDYPRFIATLSNRNFHLDTATGVITVDVPQNIQYMECDLTLTWKMGKLEFSSREITVTIPLVWTSLAADELTQKFTASVKVGNAQDGYTTVWSKRVNKNTAFDIPTSQEILEKIGYNDYKYSGYTGYEALQETTGLTTYSDVTYYFNVTPREYTLTVNGVQNADGSLSNKQFRAKFGESFDISELTASGSDTAGNYTMYLKTITSDKKTADIGAVIDTAFAKKLLAGTSYTAQYTDNSVTATFKFYGNATVGDKTVKIKKGTVPPDVFSAELSGQDISITGISPTLSNITVDTEFAVSISKYIAPSFDLNYHTNGGSTIPTASIRQGSMLIAPADPTRTGYKFAGWYTDSALKNAFNFDGALMPGAVLNLYAKWTAETFKLTFDANEGTLPDGTTNPLTVTYGSSYGTLPTPTRTSFKFLGWYTERIGGTKISGTVGILKDTDVFAHWQEKQNIDASSITYTSGQSVVYDRNEHFFTFSAGGINTNNFEVLYKRQNLDTSYSSAAVNAGTYDVKLVYKEDDSYKYFETFLSGAYTIEKAESHVFTRPTVKRTYYASLTPNKLIYDVDYVGDGALQYAVSAGEMYWVTTVPAVFSYRAKTPEADDWQNNEVLYNLYDKKDYGDRAFLFVRVAESENYKASEPLASEKYITLGQKPKALFSTSYGNATLRYELWIKTSNVDKAGTDSIISVKIGNGTYQHLDNSGNDFEQNNLDKYTIKVDAANLYTNCAGTIPVSLKYEKSGSSAGWHCDYVKMNVYCGNILLVDGAQYSVNHWFGAEDHDQKNIEETYNLTGFERSITEYLGFTGADTTVNYQVKNDDRYFDWEWENPQVRDNKYLVSYNPYEHLAAPEITASFNNTKYNRYISRTATAISVDDSDLYAAMVADGVTTLTLTHSIEFKPLNGNATVTPETVKRTKTVTFTCSDATPKLLSSNMYYQLSKSAKQFFSINRGNLTQLSSSVKPGRNGTFDVSYSLKENAGIWGTKFAVNYDKTKVEMNGYTLGDVFTESEVTAPKTFADGRYVFLASRSTFDDTTVTGKIVTLHFIMKDGADFDDYPVSLDTDVMQSVNAESGVVSSAVTSNSAKIYVSGSTSDIRSSDKAQINVSAGDSSVKSVQVKIDDGIYTNITETYSQGYDVTANGVYKFLLTTNDGETAETSITYTKIDTKKPVIAIDSGDYTNGEWTKNNISIALRNTTDNLGTTSFSYRIGESGEWLPYSQEITTAANLTNLEASYYFKAMSESGIESDVKKFDVKIDQVLPGAEIDIAANKFTSFLNNITFGLFFKNTVTVKINSSDNGGSGVAKTEYQKVTNSETFNTNDHWTEGKSFSAAPNEKFTVYARVTDTVGNEAIVNSLGTVVYSDSEADDKTATFVKTSANDVSVKVKLNGNTIKAGSIRLDGEIVPESGYTIPIDAPDTIVFQSEYLNQLTSDTHSVTVEYNPLGEKFDSDVSIGDSPERTSFSLIIALKKLDKNDFVYTAPSGEMTYNGVAREAKVDYKTIKNGSTIHVDYWKGSQKLDSAPTDAGTYTVRISVAENNYYATVESLEIATFTIEKAEQGMCEGVASACTTLSNNDGKITGVTNKMEYRKVGSSDWLKITDSMVTGLTDGTYSIRYAGDDNHKPGTEKELLIATYIGIPQATPAAVFTAATRTLSGTASGQKYRIDGGAWKEIKSDLSSEIAKACKLEIYKPSDGVYMLDSAIQTISITKANMPSLNKTDETIKSKADGKITGTTAAMEQKINGNWTSSLTTENLAAGTYTFRVKANETMLESDPVSVTIGEGRMLTVTTPSGEGYTVHTTSSKSVAYGGSFSFTVSVKGGYDNKDIVVKANESILTAQNGIYTVSNITADTSIAVAGVADLTAPTADISIGTNSIKQMGNTLTFGLFFKDTQTVTVTAADKDGSGIEKICYYLANNEITDFTEVKWSECTGTINIEPNNEYVIYVKAIDKAGNETILNSDGIILDHIVPQITGAENGKTYCGAVTLCVNDDNLNEVFVDSSSVIPVDGKITIEPKDGEQTVVVTDKSKNSATLKLTVYEAHKWNDGKVTTEATAAKEGEIVFTCEHCGEMKTEVIKKLAPSITMGENTSYKQGSKDGLTFKSNAELADFENVFVDGNVIDKTNYDIKEGSTIITLTAEYLETLSAGKHTLAINSTTGSASTEFTIEAKAADPVNPENNTNPDDNKSAQTGDSTNILFWFTLLFVSAGALTALVITKKHKKEDRK